MLLFLSFKMSFIHNMYLVARQHLNANISFDPLKQLQGHISFLINKRFLVSGEKQCFCWKEGPTVSMSVSIGHWATMSHLSCYTEPLRICKGLQLCLGNVTIFQSKIGSFELPTGWSVAFVIALPGWELVSSTVFVSHLCFNFLL